MLKKLELEKQICCALDCIQIIRNYKNKNFFIDYVKLEMGLFYYKFGYEISNSNSIKFTVLEAGLKTLSDFVEYVNTRKKVIREMF